ncbi:MAG TPA: iron ABC transporter permease [Acidimicrobiales bacterium]|nr:iron ABC transporter permease [Acidimicrobiales bacterium]
MPSAGATSPAPPVQHGSAEGPQGRSQASQTTMDARAGKLAPTRLTFWQVAAGCAFLAASAVASLMVGPFPLAPGTVIDVLFGWLPWPHLHAASQLSTAIVWQIRAPRVALAILVGAMLAAAGASYQGVFSNALADPYLLGIAAGAGLGATVAFVYGGSILGAAAGSGGGFGLMPLAAFAGAVVAVMATFALSRSRRGPRTPAALVLSGVAVAAFLTAVQSFLQEQHASFGMTALYSWLLGSVAAQGWGPVLSVLPYAGASAIVLLACRRLLDAMSLGDDEATALGVHPRRARLIVIAAATLGTAAAVSASGLIGFVGIIVPHSIRLLAGPSYRRIVPLSLLYGAGFLVLADLLARSALSPQEVPIGVVTAITGAPFFLVVMRQSGKFA